MIRSHGKQEISRVLSTADGGLQSSILTNGYPVVLRGPPGNGNGTNQSLFPYLALLRAGFTHHVHYWTQSWSLTPRFHPYPPMAGGIVSAALSVGSLRPGVTGRPDSPELGLSSLYVRGRSATVPPAFTSLRFSIYNNKNFSNSGAASWPPYYMRQ